MNMTKQSNTHFQFEETKIQEHFSPSEYRVKVPDKKEEPRLFFTGNPTREEKLKLLWQEINKISGA